MKLPDSQVRYIDIPTLQETFSDSVRMGFFDGSTVRLELCVTRLDEPSGMEPPSAHRYPVCRLALTPEATVDLFNHVQNLMMALQQAGLVKQEQSAPPGVAH